MARHFRSYNPEHPLLFPPTPQDWLPEDHLAYCVRDLISHLDLEPFRSGYSRDGRGAPAYDPALMVSLLLYGWCNHIYSSRKVARLCVEDLGGRYLAAGHTPDHRSINDFRLQHGEALTGLFLQSVHLCEAAGMVSLVQMAIDGTKLAANASKHKAMSYGRMVTDEARLVAEIKQLLARGAAEDAAEDGEFGKEHQGSLFTEEIARRKSRLERLRVAKQALEAQAQAAAAGKKAAREAEDRERQETGKRRKGGKKPPDPDQVQPRERAQRNFTDPESRIMKGGDGAWVQGYNGQIAVDGEHRIILACELTDQPADAPHLVELVVQTSNNTGCMPASVLADPGYFSDTNVETLERAGVHVVIPPDRLRHGSRFEPVAPLPAEELQELPAIARQRHQVSTAAGRQEYGERKKLVELQFGQIKGCPGHPGFRQFLRRGKRKCREEWHWVCAVQNLKKLMRFWLDQAGSAVPEAA